MNKVLVLLLLLPSLLPLFAGNAYPDIADSVFANPNLQGGIEFLIPWNIYVGGVSSTGSYELRCGDGWSCWTNQFASDRIFLSFPIIEVPSHYRVDSVSFNLYQLYSVGDGSPWVFPVWDDNQYHPCLLAHVDYGSSLEPSDFYPTMLGEPVVLSDNATPGWRAVDVTSAYRQDVHEMREMYQVMIYFDILNDMDYSVDTVNFINGYGASFGAGDRLPHLDVHLVSTTSFVSGVVTGSIHKLPVAGAVISCGDNTTTTDDQGRYRMEIASGEITVSCTDSQNNTITRTLNAIPDEVNELNFEYGEVGSEDEVAITLPVSVYPNPLVSESTIKISYSKAGRVSCSIYNLKGQLIKTIFNGIESKGNHNYNWDGRDERGKIVSSGLYLVKVSAGSKDATAKLMVVR